MVFFRVNAVGDLLTSRVERNLYEDYLWVGPVGQMPSDQCVTCIVLPEGTGNLAVRVGIGNPVPLFYGWDVSGCLVLSDSCRAVWEAVNGGVTIGTDNLDRVGLVESLLFDGPLASRTLLTGVNKFQMGELASIDVVRRKIKSSWHWLPSIQSGDIAESDALSIAKEHILGLTKAFRHEQSGLLPLTGGLDSRLLAGLASHEQSMDLHSYTFQRGPSVETWCAKKVARNLGIDHSVVNLPVKACYQDFAKVVVNNTAGMITGMHCHGIYSCERGIPEGVRNLPRIFGYFGDPVTGAMTEDETKRVGCSSPEFILQKYQRSCFPELIERYKTHILDDLDACYDAFQISGSKPGTFHEFWKIQQRQNNLITHLFSYHRSYQDAKVLLPFLDEKFVQFFLALPYELRKDRFLFKKACRELYPDLFELPTMHFKPRSPLSKLEVAFDKIESVLSHINLGQEWILSPFKYEQHEKNLYNYLKRDVQEGMDQLSDLEGLGKRNVKFPVWKYSTSKEYYRLCALGYLLS